MLWAPWDTQLSTPKGHHEARGGDGWPCSIWPTHSQDPARNFFSAATLIYIIVAGLTTSSFIILEKGRVFSDFPYTLVSFGKSYEAKSLNM